MITALRLKGAGVIEGNTKMTIKAVGGLWMRWHDQGVEVIGGEYLVLVPWSSIGSVQYTEDPAPEQLKPTQPTPEPSSADTRPDRAAKRARASARTTPSR